MNLYLTADKVGVQTGGGRVTAEESGALSALGPYTLVRPRRDGLPPFEQDADVLAQLETMYIHGTPPPKLAHAYAGCLTRSMHFLHHLGTKITYTVAAHSVAASRAEHEKFGIPYADLYPHLCDPEQWRQYSGGYWVADVLVVPSTHSRDTVQAQCRDLGVPCPRADVIPHGCDLPECDGCKGKGHDWSGGERGECIDRCSACNATGVAPIAPPPQTFTVGYLGACGPDKGVVYLMEAWKQLNYADAVLVLAGRDSTAPWVRQLWDQAGGGNVCFGGWQASLADFYNSLSLYVQPSVTEGFGIEVLEAMAHGRAVLCSTGAGACDLVRHRSYSPHGYFTVPACDPDALAVKIDQMKLHADLAAAGKDGREVAGAFTWAKVRARYQALWKELLS